MAGSFRIAEGYVEVTADESGYDRAMDRLRSKRNTVGVQLKLDDRDARTQLDRFMRERSLKVKVDLDQTALSRLRMQDLTVNLLPKMQEAAFNRAKTQLDRLTADRVVNIRASVDTRVGAQEIRNLIQRRQVRIGVDVDTRVAADSLANLTRRRTMTVQARADTADANNSLRFLTRDRTVNVRARMLGGLPGLGGGASGSAGGVGVLSSRIAQLAALAIGALPTLASLGQSIAAMGPAAAVAVPAVLSLATAFAAIKIGTSGVGDAFKAAFAPAVSSGAAAESSTRRVEAAQRSLAKAQQGVKDAEVNAAAARVQAARQIADAQQNLKDTEVNAAADRVKAARDVADAQQSMKNTVSDVADANRRAVESVAQAERELADAQKAEKRAQEDLTQARKAATEQLVDLNNQLVDGELDHREAVLRVQDAKASLDKTLANPAASQRQREEAQLTYDEAVQHLKEQEIDQQRLQVRVDAANKAGVEGSEAVAKAKQGIADADQAAIDKAQALKDAETEASRTQVEGAQKVAKAQRDVADAQVAAAKVAKDSAEQVAKAERDVADARAGAAKAAVDGARNIADAQAAVADAARALADAQTAGATAVNKLADAMAKLSPNAREFVNTVLAQSAAWRGLKLDVQDALFRGLGGTFTNLTTAVIPPLRTGLTGMASNLNQMAKSAASAVIELSKTGTLRQMFDGLNAGFANLNRVPGQFLTGLTQISVAASPAFARLTDAAGGAADRISKKIADAFKSGRLEDSINGAVEVAKQFGHLIGDIFGTLGNIMKAAGAAGGDALGGLGAVFKELRRITAMPEVQKALTSIFTAVNAIAKLLAGTLGAVIQAVMPLLAALAPVVTQLAEQFGPVLADLARALGTALAPIIDALLPVIKTIGSVLSGVVRGLLPLLKPLGDLVGAFISAWAPMLSALGDALVPLIAALAKGLAPVVAGLVPIIQMAGQLIAGLAPLFPQLITALLPLIPPLSQLATALLALALQVITPLMPLITGLAGLLATVLAGAVGLLVPVITTVIGWLTKLAEGVTKVVKWIADGFQWLFDFLVGHSIIPDMVKAIIRWFTTLWTRTKEIYTALKAWVVNTWNSLWKAVADRWNSFWNGFRTSLSNAKTSVLNWVSVLKASFVNTWSSLWIGASSKLSSGLAVLRSKLGDFKTWMLNAVRALRDGTGNLFKGIQSGFAAPIKWVVSHVYNDGVRKMWNTIAGKISSKITLPSIKLGFNKGGVVPGTGSSDTVPAMLTPGERILSNQQVTQLGGHRGIDAMLGQDRPTKTGGNPTSQQERKRHQATQGFASGGIIGNVTSAIGGAVSSAASWAKDLVVGGLKSAAQKAISALVRPLINRIPGGGLGSLMKGLSSKALDGMLGFLGGEDKKAIGGPAVQKALSWVKTQDGLPYQWAGNGNPSWDCSGLMSAIESVIRGERPHRRWATGSFSGSSGPAGWVRNLNSPFMIGITNAGVGHTAGTIAGMNVESSGGAGVHMGKSARGHNDPMFTSRWGFAPAAKFDSGGLLQPGATMAINKTGRPERVLDAQQTAMFEQLVRTGGAAGGVTIENITVSGTFDFSSPSSRKAAANAMVAEMKEALRLYDRGRAR